MILCERCTKSFNPSDLRITLCDDCINEIISNHEQDCPRSTDESESQLILQSVMDELEKGINSPIQQLLESPGVVLALSRLTATGHSNIHMFTLNCFRIGAYLAFKQAKLARILK